MGRKIEATCSVSVTKQISSAKCIVDQSYGCYSDNQSMWVSSGCRAVFKCDGVDGVDCESEDKKFVVCPCTAPAAQTWLRPLSGGAAAVALHNPNTMPQKVTVRFADVPERQWNENTKLHVRDLWAHKDIGIFTGTFAVDNVAAHGTAVIKLQ